MIPEWHRSAVPGLETAKGGRNLLSIPVSPSHRKKDRKNIPKPVYLIKKINYILGDQCMVSICLGFFFF